MNISIRKSDDGVNANIVVREMRNDIPAIVRQKIPLGASGEVNTKDLAYAVAWLETEIENRFAAEGVI